MAAGPTPTAGPTAAPSSAASGSGGPAPIVVDKGGKGPSRWCDEAEDDRFWPQFPGDKGYPVEGKKGFSKGWGKSSGKPAGKRGDPFRSTLAEGN